MYTTLPKYKATLAKSKINAGVKTVEVIRSINQALGTDIKAEDAPFIYIDEELNITFGTSPAGFINSTSKELSPYEVLSLKVVNAIRTYGHYYYFVEFDVPSASLKIYRGFDDPFNLSGTNDSHYSSGNYFNTREDAESYVSKVKISKVNG